jgi:Uncharacterized protein conserved in bacteria
MNKNNINETNIITEKKKINIFNTDLFARILSVLLAFVIWFYVMTFDNPSYNKTFADIPIEIDDSSMEFSTYTPYEYKVNVTLEGKKGDITALTLNDINAYVDTSEVTASGRYTLDVIISVPNNITVTEQTLNTVTVFFDNKSSTVVPVVPELVSFVLEDGYEIDRSAIELDINSVEVTGPQSLLDTIDRAQVNLVLGNVRNSLTVKGTLVLINGNNEVISSANVKLQRTEVTASIPVYVYKTIPLKVDYKYGYYANSNTETQITPRSIRIKGESSILNEIDSYTLLTIDEKNTVDNFNTTITLPNNVINVDNITQANILLTRKNTVDKRIVVSDITVNNPKNFDYDLIDESINITIRGDSQYMNYITERDIRAEIDLSHITNATGTTSVIASIIISDNYSKQVYELGDYKVSVRIN